jgi:small conductance mechanosensitive channel
MLGSLLAQDAAAEAAATISGWLELAREYLQVQGSRVAVNLIGAVLIFLVGRWIAGIVTRIVSRLMGRAKVEPMLVRFVENVLYFLLLTVAIMAALDLLGVDTTSLAAVLAAAGFAIGMALQGSLSNFAAGIVLIVTKPFRVGDVVQASGVSGVIEEVQLFSTVIRTADNETVIIPNGTITSANITNYTRKGTRRIDLTIGCAYGDDLRAIKQYLTDLVTSDARVLETPAPEIIVSALADSSITLQVRPWVKADDWWATRCDLLERIKLGFDERGFTFPYPSRDLYIQKHVKEELVRAE